MSRKVHSRVALVVADPRRLSSDDTRLTDAFGRRGIAVTVCAWDDAEVCWGDFDAAIVRAVRASLRNPYEFADWMDRVESFGVVVMNPPPLLRSNAAVSNAAVSNGAVMNGATTGDGAMRGLWSLVFLGGEYSHALVDRRRREPAPWLIADARDTLAATAHAAGVPIDEILTARVEGVIRGGRFAMASVDAAEPLLDLARARGTADRLAQLVERRMRQVARG